MTTSSPDQWTHACGSSSVVSMVARHQCWLRRDSLGNRRRPALDRSGTVHNTVFATEAVGFCRRPAKSVQIEGVGDGINLSRGQAQSPAVVLGTELSAADALGESFGGRGPQLVGEAGEGPQRSHLSRSQLHQPLVGGRLRRIGVRQWARVHVREGVAAVRSGSGRPAHGTCYVSGEFCAGVAIGHFGQPFTHQSVHVLLEASGTLAVQGPAMTIGLFTLMQHLQRADPALPVPHARPRSLDLRPQSRECDVPRGPRLHAPRDEQGAASKVLQVSGDGRWHRHDSRILFAGGPQGRIQLAVDEAVRPDGEPVEYPYVSAPDSVRVLAVHNGRIPTVSQHHYLHDVEITDLPGGLVDEGEEPADAARRELSEETGLEAAWLYPLGRVVTARAASTEQVHLFLAHGCTEGKTSPDAGEAVQTHWRTWHELEQADAMALLSGTSLAVADAASLAAIQRAGQLLQAVGGTLPSRDDDLPKAAWAAYTATTGLSPYAEPRLGMVWLDLALGRTAQGAKILAELEEAYASGEAEASWSQATHGLWTLAQEQ